MAVIAMTREMGTLGKDVAAGIADELGLSVVHHEIVERQLAERLQTSESAVHRFLEGDASLWERWKIDRDRVSRFTAEEILELTIRGNVLIRGWGAAQLLRDVPHVICVRVCAPMTNRINEIKRRLQIGSVAMARSEIERNVARHEACSPMAYQFREMQRGLRLDSSAVARREIERNDEAHERAVRRQFRVDWRDATGYDLVLNTGSVPVSTAVAVLKHLTESGAYEATDASRAILGDKLLEARIQTLIDSRMFDSPIGSGLLASVGRGHVCLKGVITHDRNRRGVVGIVDEIKKMKGVASITDETHCVPSNYGP